MSKFFFCEDFFTFFFLKSAKGVSINYVDTFKTASSPSLDLCPHAWNKLAYSDIFINLKGYFCSEQGLSAMNFQGEAEKW